MENIKTIIFDMGGVLLDLHMDNCLKAFADIGFSEFSQYIDPYAQQGFFLKLEQGKITTEEFCEEIRRLSGKNIANTDIIHALVQFAETIPEYKLTMLLALRKKYRIFLLSNCNDITIDYLKRAEFSKQGLTIDDYFDRLYLSYKMDCTKPDPLIFKKLLADSGIHPEETFFLDDGPKNIITASEIGFKTYLVHPKEDFRHLFF